MACPYGMRIRLSNVKFIIIPFCGIIDDVFGYALKGFIISDDVIMKPGLPREFVKFIFFAPTG